MNIKKNKPVTKLLIAPVRLAKENVPFKKFVKIFLKSY